MERRVLMAVVTTTGDAGPGSLRQAILDTNASPTDNAIAFNIDSSAPTISPQSPLPLILDPVTIDGTTQPGFAGAPIIEINGAGAGATNGLDVRAAAGSTIRGLVVNRFSGAGIFLLGGGARVEGCYIGTDVAGASLGLGNSSGILVGSPGNTIGGTTAGTRNVISGNTLGGILVTAPGAIGNVISGNYIGTNASGTAALGNFTGILLDSTGNVIGGTTAAARNVISGNGTGILVTGPNATGNAILGNYVGTDASGTASLGNNNGIELVSAGNNTIGGATAGARNVLSGNGTFGIWIRGAAATGNAVLGNYVGTDATGTASLGNPTGIFLESSGNTIGGEAAGARNLIAGNVNSGLQITGTTAINNRVLGNYVGTDAAGTRGLGNNNGITIESSGNVIGGEAAGARNLIAGNRGIGVFFSGAGATGNRVLGNYVGTDASGSESLGNGGGILLDTAGGNVIGGEAAGARNVISGNANSGVQLIGAAATGNAILGNYIGTDATGTAALGNDNGILLVESSFNTVGGATAGARNLIAGNRGTGVSLGSLGPTGATGNAILGNYIGTDASGTRGLGNLGSGIEIGLVVARNNTIGGTAAGERNVISANNNGIRIRGAGTTGNAILGNYVGTDATGTAALGNRFDGIIIFEAGGNTIGGTTAGARNVIAGNGASGQGGGLSITGPNNLVQGNYIGTDASGTRGLGNVVGGIGIGVNASGNTIGGAVAGARNVISGNLADGVIISSDDATGNLILGNAIGLDASGFAALGNLGTGVVIVGAARGNAILANSIFANGGLGIDLGDDGVTPNDPGDGDLGPDTLQNFPILASAVASGGSTLILGTLNSRPGPAPGAPGSYRIEFFANDALDPSGNGEGQLFLGSVDVTTDALGDATFAFASSLAVPGQIITATATSLASDQGANNTSEFSATVRVLPTIIDADYSVVEGDDGVTSIILVYRLDAPSRLPVSFDISPINGTAIAGVDFVPFAATIRFAPGQVVQQFAIGVIGDLALEADETFLVQISNPVNAIPRRPLLLVTIANDDGTVVTNTNDAGRGSLRQAILNANLAPGLNTIAFAIPGAGARTIRPLTPLPALSDRTIIDGASQAAFAGVATFAPLVEIDGRSVAGIASGLQLVAGSASSRVSRLSIFGFRGPQIGLGSDANSILGNYLGLRSDGTIPGAGGTLAPMVDPSSVGLLVDGSGNSIGSSIQGERNVISGNAGQGVEIRSNGNPSFVGIPSLGGNLIGLDPTGTEARGNGIHGILINPGVVGVFVTAGNVISGNGGNGIQLVGASFTFILGSFIGTDITGSRAIGNTGAGIGIVQGSNNNTVGLNIGNVISGNGSLGIAIRDGSYGNSVINSLIGTDATGRVSVGNGSTGILVSEAPGNFIGPGNVVSGNGTSRDGAGIWIEGAASRSNVVRGNLIGTDAAGTGRLGNAVVGVLINDAPGNTVGGPSIDDVGQRNVISGNGQVGVMISGPDATGNLVLGNLIGTDATGTAAVGNGRDNAQAQDGAGVYINGAPGNTIGGADAAVRNVISGNRADGVVIFSADATGNLVQGNFIGTDIAGLQPLGNRRDGVVIVDAAGNAIVGNVISDNRRNGVVVGGGTATANTVAANAIGLGLAGGPLGNRAFGVLLTDRSRGNTIAADNRIGNNFAGQVRIAPGSSATASPMVAARKASRSKAAKAKVLPKAKSFGGRALQVGHAKKPGQARAKA